MQVCAEAGKGENRMKHRVTVDVETRKHFLGIPYTATEKKHIMVDGKMYRKMKKEEQEKRARREDEVAAAALVVLEEEIADLFGE